MSITAPSGFLAAGTHAGIKSSDELDMALIASESGVNLSAAGVFTSNTFAAAPVGVSRANLQKTKGQIRAVVINSGNANAATGQQGEDDALYMCDLTAQQLGCDPSEVLVCSTGLIGFNLPMKAINKGIVQLANSLSADAETGSRAAQAICTTDTKTKEHLHEGEGFKVGAMGKGAAMLSPDMGTMLGFITTDAMTEGMDLHKVLKSAVDSSFNKLTVDGVQSTNDTVFLMSSQQGPKVSEKELTSAVSECCQSLARQMAADAEGSTKTVRVMVSGTKDSEQAERVARYIANSILVKCSWHGADPYWGRIASEIGASKVGSDINKLAIAYGCHHVYKNGAPVEISEAETAELNSYMESSHLDLKVDLGMGSANAEIFTCDLGHGYIEENSQTS